MLLNLAVALLATVSTVQGQTTPRSITECALLTGNVYCFFGFKFTSATENVMDNVINVLDLTNATGKSASELESQWKPVSSNTNGVDIIARQLPQAAPLGDGRRIFFNGGYNPSSSRLVDPTIIYDAVENKWTKGAPYTEPPYGPRQIYYGSAVQTDKGLALYGGFEEFINASWTTPSSNVTAFNFANNLSRSIGFTQVAFYNINNANQPWSVPVPLTTWTTPFIAWQKSVYDPLKHRVLFLGGETRLNDQNNYNTNGQAFQLSKSWTFDTINSTWLTIDLGGDVPANGRFYFSLTLAPSTNRDVILFGGEINDKVSDDYCFTLNLDTNQWKRNTINAPAGTPLARSRHSAVLTSNDTLLIMWGVDGNKAGLSSILMLNVSDPYAISLSEKFVGVSTVVNNGNSSNANNGGSNNSNSNNSKESSGLSGGAKGGIAAACVLGGLAVAGLFAFLRRKKSKKDQGNLELTNSLYQPSPQQGNQDVVPMEVDWDKLEEKYTELPMQNMQQYQTPNKVDSSDMGSTAVGQPFMDARRGYSPNLNQESTGVSFMNPNSVDDNASHIDGQSHPRILKPDIGHNA